MIELVRAGSHYSVFLQKVSIECLIGKSQSSFLNSNRLFLNFELRFSLIRYISITSIKLPHKLKAGSTHFRNIVNNNSKFWKEEDQHSSSGRKFEKKK